MFIYFKLRAVLVIDVIKGEGVHGVHVGAFVIFLPLRRVDGINVVIFIDGDLFLIWGDLDLEIL
jgi:hypothetical protein